VDLKPYVERLRATVNEAKAVKFALSLAVIKEQFAVQQIGDAWLYVSPRSEEPSRNPYATGLVGQQIAVGFSVFIVLKNVKDVLGDDAADVLERVKRPVQKALQGWHCPGTNMPTEIGSGRVAGFSDFVTIWQQDFLTGTSESTEES
jgi:hypothetical protein